MKPLSLNKNMPSIQRKPTRKFTGLPTIHNSQNIIYNDIQQLIFKIEVLPISLELQINQYKEVRLTISNNSVQIKNNGQSFAVALNLSKSKWMRLLLDQQVKTVELKYNNPENKIDKNQIYTKYQTWNGLFKETIHNLQLKSLLLLSKNKNQKRNKLVEVQPKSSLSSFMKNRFSQRTNNIKQSLIPFRVKNETFSNLTENQNYSTSANQLRTEEKTKQNISINKMQSQRICSTLDIDKNTAKNKYFFNLKESNTSTSISIEPEISLNKRLRKIRDIKVPKSQKQVAYDGASEIFQIKQKNKLDQYINLSQQQIQIKRQKFDSQFIYKKQLPSMPSKEMSSFQKNESEVTEDICKMQSSKNSNILEDTLEKGFAGNIKNPQQVSESGTLYESVYE